MKKDAKMMVIITVIIIVLNHFHPSLLASVSLYLFADLFHKTGNSLASFD